MIGLVHRTMSGARGVAEATLARRGKLDADATHLKSVKRIITLFNENVGDFENIEGEYENLKREEETEYQKTFPTKMFESGHLKLRGMDVNLVRCMLDEFRNMLQDLLSAKEVHLLSCPYDGSFSGPTSKAFEVKTGLKKQREGVFVFDPNTEMELFALSRFYDEESQSTRWLEI